MALGEKASHETSREDEQKRAAQEESACRDQSKAHREISQAFRAKVDGSRGVIFLDAVFSKDGQTVPAKGIVEFSKSFFRHSNIHLAQSCGSDRVRADVQQPSTVRLTQLLVVYNF
jgi:hypothetical protein